jgi:hypothetical protein
MMFRIPLYAKIAGAGTAGLLLAGGAALTAAPTISTALAASTQPTPGAKAGAAQHGKRIGIRARRLVLRAEAQALNLTARELRMDLRSGTSVEQLAGKAGMDKAQFTAAVVAKLKPMLDKLVKAGKLNQNQANALVDRVQKGFLPGWTLKPKSAPGTASPSASQSQTS